MTNVMKNREIGNAVIGESAFLPGIPWVLNFNYQITN
jgi:hypothetical protein